MPTQPFHATRLRKDLLAQLNEVKDATLVVDDDKILREAIFRVKAVCDLLLNSCPKSNGLPLRSSPFVVSVVRGHSIIKEKKKSFSRNCRNGESRKDS